MTDMGTSWIEDSDPQRGFYLLNTDGSGTGTIANPAQGAIGAVLEYPDGKAVPGGEISEWIGPATNTIAEYWAFIEGLRLALSHNIERVDVRLDSALVVDQIHGDSKVTKEYLRPLYRRALALVAEFGDGNIKISWVDRKYNARADALATKALRSRREDHRTAKGQDSRHHN